MNQQRHSFRAMGSGVDLLAAGAPRGTVRWAIGRVRQLERCWSRFMSDSELVMLNRRAGQGPVTASDDLRLAVGRALRLWWATDGLFDPTTLAALESAGYDRTFRSVPRHRTTGTGGVAAVPTPLGVVVDDEAGTIELPAGVRLDLGGVGKGLAADLITRGLVERGALGACISMGGDVAVAGSTGESSVWMIPVEDPFEDGVARWQVPLTEGALVQSTRLLRTWRVGDEIRHHLIDPRTGTSACSGLAAVVVLADEAWWAEGVAKAALVAGPAAGSRMIERLARGGWLIRDDRSVTLAGPIAVGRAA